MKSRTTTFFIGVLTGAVGLGVALLLPRYFPLRRAVVPVWSRQDVVEKGFADFRKGTEILGRWDVGPIAKECISDFDSMAIGHARLGLVFAADSGRYLVLLFPSDRDQWGRSVADRVMAYVYDTEAKSLIGKFWVPMA